MAGFSSRCSLEWDQHHVAHHADRCYHECYCCACFSPTLASHECEGKWENYAYEQYHNDFDRRCGMVVEWVSPKPDFRHCCLPFLSATLARSQEAEKYTAQAALLLQRAMYSWHVASTLVCFSSRGRQTGGKRMLHRGISQSSIIQSVRSTSPTMLTFGFADQAFWADLLLLVR